LIFIIFIYIRRNRVAAICILVEKNVITVDTLTLIFKQCYDKQYCVFFTLRMVETIEGEDVNDEIPKELDELHIAYPPQTDDMIADTRSRMVVKVFYMHLYFLQV